MVWASEMVPLVAYLSFRRRGRRRRPRSRRRHLSQDCRLESLVGEAELMVVEAGSMVKLYLMVEVGLMTKPAVMVEELQRQRLFLSPSPFPFPFLSCSSWHPYCD